MSFAKSIRDSFARWLPDFRYSRSTPGPGTFVIFERERQRGRIRWSEDIWAQRSKYGNWFRLNVGLSPIIARGECNHGENSGVSPFGADVPLEGSDIESQVAFWFANSATKVRQQIDRHLEKASRPLVADARACPKLPTLFAAWYRKEGRLLPTEHFLAVAPDFRERAREAFARRMSSRVTNKVCIQTFWDINRPRRVDEDDGRLATCHRCGAQRPRPQMATRPARDPALRKLGLIEFVCKRACK
jgi:hypothetical protein